MNILLLAGTGEARELAGQLVNIPGIDVTASLAGATRQPMKLACTTRIGGFGGAKGFRTYLKENDIQAIVDATHPFAVKMSSTAWDLAQDLNIPCVQLLRDQWDPQAGDRWTLVDGEQEVAAFIPTGATVFLATGRQTLERFDNLLGRHLICRRIDTPKSAFPLPNGRFLVGRPPFSVDDEVALFRELAVDWLVVKNSGGQASRTKLDAAKKLRIPVAMINRPAQPASPKLATVAQTLDWAVQQMGS